MRQIDRYLGRSLLGGAALALLALAAVDAMISLVDEVKDVDDDYTLADAALYTVLMLVAGVYELLPVAVLVGAVISLGNLAAQSELVAFRALHYSRARITASVLMSGALLMVFAFVLGETAVPAAVEKAQQIKHAQQEPQAAPQSAAGNALQVCGAAIAGRNALHCFAEALQPAHPRKRRAGMNLDRVAAGQRAAAQGARHHRAEAAPLEDAINPQPRGAAAPQPRFGAPGGRVQRAAQRGQPRAALRGYADNFRIGQRALRHLRAGFRQRQFRYFGFGGVHFGKRHHAVPQSQQSANIEMLPGLRHYAFIGGHRQQQHIKAARARHHGAHQCFVSGNIHHAEPPPRRQNERREAQLDGDAAGLFLGQAVGVAAGKRAHQRGLAVINVPGSAENQRGAVLPGQAMSASTCWLKRASAPSKRPKRSSVFAPLASAIWMPSPSSKSSFRVRIVKS